MSATATIMELDEYRRTAGGISLVTGAKGEAVERPLTNFFARIIEDITLDEGEGEEHRFVIQADVDG